MCETVVTGMGLNYKGVIDDWELPKKCSCKHWVVSNTIDCYWNPDPTYSGNQAAPLCNYWQQTKFNPDYTSSPCDYQTGPELGVSDGGCGFKVVCIYQSNYNRRDNMNRKCKRSPSNCDYVTGVTPRTYSSRSDVFESPWLEWNWDERNSGANCVYHGTLSKGCVINKRDYKTFHYYSNTHVWHTNQFILGIQYLYVKKIQIQHVLVIGGMSCTVVHRDPEAIKDLKDLRVGQDRRDQLG